MKRELALAGLCVLLCTGAAEVFADPVELAVNFKLTDLDYKPLPNVPVRVVFSSDSKWQSPKAGNSFVTDAAGEGHFKTHVTLEKVLRKVPTNYLSELVNPPVMMDHISPGAELEYAGHHWLYVEEIYRLPDGDNMLADSSLYSRDANGNFTAKATYDGINWMIADLNGLALSGPGYESWDHMLDHGADEKHWTLKLAFKKSPEPVRR